MTFLASSLAAASTNSLKQSPGVGPDMLEDKLRGPQRSLKGLEYASKEVK